MMMIGIEGK